MKKNLSLTDKYFYGRLNKKQRKTLLQNFENMVSENVFLDEQM